MPRESRKAAPKQSLSAQQLWYQVTGNIEVYGLADWDPETAHVCNALLELLGAGLTVVLRPGSGGRALGVAIWQGDNRPPATWFGDQDELNAWARSIMEAAARRRASEQPNGA